MLVRFFPILIDSKIYFRVDKYLLIIFSQRFFMVINVNDYLLSQGHLIPGFSGIGNFKGRRANEYSQDESTILEHFFTNIDSNVYAAKDTMPSQLWALVMGQYARSPVTLKERLLSILREVPKKDPSAPSLEELASSIRNNGDINDRLLRHLDKASAFIVEFGIDYGHASLRDSGVIRMCFEGVSQEQTKFLEEAREGAYQEQSTRALSFTDGLAMPFEVRGTRFQRRFAELGEKLIKFYSKVYDTSESWLKKEYADLREDADKKIRDSTGNQEAKLSDPAWNRVIGEKAFDIARFLLPQFATTSLGMTLNTRRFQDILTAWQSSEFDEIRLLGKAAQVEAAKLFPYLLVYGDYK
jgi:thymidylate synthase ThyX